MRWIQVSSILRYLLKMVQRIGIKFCAKNGIRWSNILEVLTIAYGECALSWKSSHLLQTFPKWHINSRCKRWRSEENTVWTSLDHYWRIIFHDDIFKITFIQFTRNITSCFPWFAKLYWYLNISSFKNNEDGVWILYRGYFRKELWLKLSQNYKGNSLKEEIFHFLHFQMRLPHFLSSEKDDL